MKNIERENIIIKTSFLGIIANVFIATIKIVVGLFTSSFAIVTEGFNNAGDALTSILSMVGAKLSTKHPDEKHPFGYGRIEYLTGLAISLIILYTGIESLKESIKGIINPGDMQTSIIVVILILVSAIVKFFLGTYTIDVGNKTESQSLIAIGYDCRNDSFMSIITIVSVLIFMFFKYSIDAYVGVFFAIILLRVGFKTLMESVSDIIGKPAGKELAAKIYKEVRNTPHVIGAADLMLHNYGPDRFSGSINIEVDHEKTIGEIYEIVHELQLHIMHEYKVTMVFGMYAVDDDHEEIKEMRKYIVDYILKHKDINSMHALYHDSKEKRIYCDFIVSYNLLDWDFIQDDFARYMKEKYPNDSIELTIETDFV